MDDEQASLITQINIGYKEGPITFQFNEEEKNNIDIGYYEKIDNVITHKIQGDTGNFYTLTQDGDDWTCTCRGFIFSKDIPKSCKHIKTQKTILYNNF
jgi:hypothetical protein